MNMAEIELNVLNNHCLGHRIESIEKVVEEIDAWEYGQSIVSIFDLLSSQAEEENITQYLMELFLEIIEGIGEKLKIDCMELFREMIRDNQKAEEIMRLFSLVFEQKSTA